MSSSELLCHHILWLTFCVITLAMATAKPLSLAPLSPTQMSPPPSLPPTSQQPTKGYPTLILGLALNEIDPNFLCGYCNSLLREPAQVSCGHRFCQICLTTLLENQTGPLLCPQCTQEGIGEDNPAIYSNHFPDKAIKRLMDKQKIACANVGCGWKGILLNYSSHEKVCPVATVTCPNQGCEVETHRSELSAHLEQCPQRSVPCKSCLSIVPLDGIEEHLRCCPSTRVKTCVEDSAAWQLGLGCPFGCAGKWYNLASFDIHAEEFTLKHLGEVNRRIVNLERAVLQSFPEQAPTQVNSGMENVDNTGPGPSQQHITNVEMLQHAAENRGATISGVSNARLEVEIQHIAKRLRALESKCQFDQANSTSSPSNSLEFVFATGSPSNESSSPPQLSLESNENTAATAMRKLELCYRKAETYEGMTMVLNISLDRLLNQVAKIDIQRRKENETLNLQARKIQELETALALKSVALDEQFRKIEMRESTTSYNGMFVWKISNFAKKKQDAMDGTRKSIYSPCFYTSRFGYKMCGRSVPRHVVLGGMGFKIKRKRRHEVSGTLALLC